MAFSPVFVVMPNHTERALIVAELEENGINARGIESLSELFAELAGGAEPRVLVLDSALRLSDDKLGAVKNLAPDAEIIVISGAFGSEENATHLLRRPFTIGELASKIKQSLHFGR